LGGVVCFDDVFHAEHIVMTLAVADDHFSLNITTVIERLGGDFRETLDSFYAS
jgi:hypothetical protein